MKSKSAQFKAGISFMDDEISDTCSKSGGEYLRIDEPFNPEV
jgi:hypothetical protein